MAYCVRALNVGPSIGYRRLQASSRAGACSGPGCAPLRVRSAFFPNRQVTTPNPSYRSRRNVSELPIFFATQYISIAHLDVFGRISSGSVKWMHDLVEYRADFAFRYLACRRRPGGPGVGSERNFPRCSSNMARDCTNLALLCTIADHGTKMMQTADVSRLLIKRLEAEVAIRLTMPATCCSTNERFPVAIGKRQPTRSKMKTRVARLFCWSREV
jgi:hypothetical protein